MTKTADDIVVNYSGYREMIKGNWVCPLPLIITKQAANQLYLEWAGADAK